MNTNQRHVTAHKLSMKGCIQTLFILVFMSTVMFGMANVLRSKSGDDNIMTPYTLEDHTWDVIFAGSSHMNNAVSPMEMWEKYGFASYNNAQSGQIIPVSYYACKEVIERYSPKVLVLDLYMLYHAKEYGNLTWMHQSMDTMKAVNRIAATIDLVPWENKKEFLFPITLYHTRWKELRKKDFHSTPSVSKGWALNLNKAEDLAEMSYEEVPESVKIRPGDVPVAYLDKIVQLCKQFNTELLLITLPYCTSPDVEKPTHDMSNDQAYFNWAADYAMENDIQYINYFHLVDELGFEWSECMYNYSHMNYWGAQIITEHLGRYLSQQYELPDRRTDPSFSYWNDDLKQYRQNVKKALEKSNGKK